MKSHRASLAVTTCKHYLLDVGKFLAFVREENFSQVRLQQNCMLSIDRVLRMELSTLSKKIVTHCQEVSSEKSKKLFTSEQIHSCERKGNPMVPQKTGENTVK